MMTSSYPSNRHYNFPYMKCCIPNCSHHSSVQSMLNRICPRKMSRNQSNHSNFRHHTNRHHRRMNRRHHYCCQMMCHALQCPCIHSCTTCHSRFDMYPYIHSGRKCCKYIYSYHCSCWHRLPYMCTDMLCCKNVDKYLCKISNNHLCMNTGKCCSTLSYTSRCNTQRRHSCSCSTSVAMPSQQPSLQRLVSSTHQA